MSQRKVSAIYQMRFVHYTILYYTILYYTILYYTMVVVTNWKCLHCSGTETETTMIRLAAAKEKHSEWAIIFSTEELIME